MNLKETLKQAQAAALDPSKRNPGKAEKLLDKVLAALERVDAGTHKLVFRKK